MRPEIHENCSCSETCCPSSKKSDGDIKNLLRVCYTEWVIMAILATMIMMKMETYLDDEEWMWFIIYSTILFLFSLPFVVSFHRHSVPRCNCNDKESRTSSPKPNNASEESESSSSSVIVEKVKRKSKSKKRNSKTKSEKNSKSKKRNVKIIKNKRKSASVAALTKSSSECESSSSSIKEFGITKKVQDFLGFGMTSNANDESSSEESPLLLKKEEPTTIIVEKDIFKGSDAENEERTVEAKLVIKKEPALPGEEVKLEYDLIVNVDPDEEDHMIVNVQGQVEGGVMDVSTHAATEGEGQANVEAEIQHGAKKDKGELEIVVCSETDGSSDEMNLKAGKTKKTEITKE